MQTDKTKTIEGENIYGESKKYTFNLINAEAGLEIYHSNDFMSLFMAANELIKMVNSDEIDSLGSVAITQMFSKFVDWEGIKKLSETILANATIEINGDKMFIPKSGIVPNMGDPADQYVTLSYGLYANFPKYVPFFEQALDSGEEETEEKEEGQS